MSYAPHDGRLRVETGSSLILVFSTTESDDGKNEVIGFLGMEEIRGLSTDWTLDNCDVSVPGASRNGVEEAGDVWSDTFMRRMATYLAFRESPSPPRAMPPRLGLRGWLEPGHTRLPAPV